MIKVEDRAAIPEARRQNPESEQLSILTDKGEIAQSDEDEQLMGLEIALVRALQYLAAKSESSQP
jgi:hypothetical protein